MKGGINKMSLTKIGSLLKEVIGTCKACSSYHTIARESELNTSPESDENRKKARGALQNLADIGSGYYSEKAAPQMLNECSGCDRSTPKAYQTANELYEGMAPILDRIVEV